MQPKRVGMGALIGAGLGAVTFGVVELMIQHTNHEDDPMVAGMLFLSGAAAGAIAGLL